MSCGEDAIFPTKLEQGPEELAGPPQGGLSTAGIADTAPAAAPVATADVQAAGDVPLAAPLAASVAAPVAAPLAADSVPTADEPIAAAPVELPAPADPPAAAPAAPLTTVTANTSGTSDSSTQDTVGSNASRGSVPFEHTSSALPDCVTKRHDSWAGCFARNGLQIPKPHNAPVPTQLYPAKKCQICMHARDTDVQFESCGQWDYCCAQERRARRPEKRRTAAGYLGGYWVAYSDYCSQSA